MRYTIRCIIALGFASMMTFLSGCSSVMTHTGPYQGYYPGARNDVRLLKDEETGWAMTPLVALDLPFSAVIDTLLLPYDYYRSDKDTTQDSPRERILRGSSVEGEPAGPGKKSTQVIY